MTGYTFALSCNHCGGELEHLADGLPSRAHTTAVARCTNCRRQWQPIVYLVPVIDPRSEYRREYRAKLATA